MTGRRSRAIQGRRGSARHGTRPNDPRARRNDDGRLSPDDLEPNGGIRLSDAQRLELDLSARKARDILRALPLGAALVLVDDELAVDVSAIKPPVAGTLEYDKDGDLALKQLPNISQIPDTAIVTTMELGDKLNEILASFTTNNHMLEPGEEQSP